LDGVVRAKRPKHVPVVLTENEVRALLAQLEGARYRSCEDGVVAEMRAAYP